MADRGGDSVFLHGGICIVWRACCQSILRADECSGIATRFHLFSNHNSDTFSIGDTNKSTDGDAHSRRNADSFSNIHPDRDCESHTDEDSYRSPNHYPLSNADPASLPDGKLKRACHPRRRDFASATGNCRFVSYSHSNENVDARAFPGAKPHTYADSFTHGHT